MEALFSPQPTSLQASLSLTCLNTHVASLCEPLWVGFVISSVGSSKTDPKLRQPPGHCLLRHRGPGSAFCMGGLVPLCLHIRKHRKALPSEQVMSRLNVQSVRMSSLPRKGEHPVTCFLPRVPGVHPSPVSHVMPSMFSHLSIYLCTTESPTRGRDLRETHFRTPL